VICKKVLTLSQHVTFYSKLHKNEISVFLLPKNINVSVGKTTYLVINITISVAFCRDKWVPVNTGWLVLWLRMYERPPV